MTKSERRHGFKSLGNHEYVNLRNLRKKKRDVSSSVCNSLTVYDNHKLTLEHVQVLDSENYSRNANKTSILEGSS